MDPRETRRERRKERGREEILEATRRVLLERGLAGLTLSAVAREVQLTKAALYYYFSSKNALVGELLVMGLNAHANVVGAAVERTTSGVEALETLIRASTQHYGEHVDDLRLAYLVPQVGTAGAIRIDPELLARIRPANDRIYGTTAEKIRADQLQGLADASVDPRRLCFLAHMAVLGMLTVEGLVAVTDHAPLIHPRAGMVDELVRTFTGRLAPQR